MASPNHEHELQCTSTARPELHLLARTARRRRRACRNNDGASRAKLTPRVLPRDALVLRPQVPEEAPQLGRAGRLGGAARLVGARDGRRRGGEHAVVHQRRAQRAAPLAPRHHLGRPTVERREGGEYRQHAHEPRARAALLEQRGEGGREPSGRVCGQLQRLAQHMRPAGATGAEQPE